MTVNFAAGPNQLPLAVQLRLLEDAKEFGISGISAWETSHRDDRIHVALDRVRVLIRELLEVPDDFEILLTQGGATGMFTAWPQNIVPARKARQRWGRRQSIDIILSGHWATQAHLALQEVERGKVARIANVFHGWDSVTYQKLTAGFLYMVSNETVNGTQLRDWGLLPANAPPLVVDMSSNIMTGTIDWRRVAMVFASTQKDLGIAFGACLVIVRKDLLEATPHPLLPAPLSFKEQLKHRGGLRNTVNPLGVLSMLYTLEWIRERGGVQLMQARAAARAKILYDAINESGGFFEGLAPTDQRSDVNVTFRVTDESRRKAFLDFCADEGCVGLKGHKALDGTWGEYHVRASMYVGATAEDPEVLAELMRVFPS